MYRKKFLRAIKRNHHRRARIYRIKWVRAHRKLTILRRIRNKALCKHLKRKIIRHRKILYRLIKKERKIRRSFIRHTHVPSILRRIRKQWRVVRRRISKIRKVIFVARKRRITIKIRYFKRILNRRIKKMLRLRRAINRANRRGNHGRAALLRRKFVVYQRRVRKFKVVAFRYRQRLIKVRVHRYRRLYIRAIKRARKMKRMIRLIRAKSGGSMTFCATVLQGQYRKALKLARKYRHIFHKIRVTMVL